MPIQKDNNNILMPLVTGFTTMLLGKTVLELVTRGAIHSPDLMADSYLAVMASYAGAGEWEKWKHPEAWDPQNDPWVERAQRGGVFLLLWSLPFFAAYLWRLWDASVPYPVELKRIWTGLFGIFLAKNTSRSIRHTRKGQWGDAALDAGASGLDREILAFLSGRPNRDAATGDVCTQFPDVSRRHLTRLLTALHEQRLVERTLRGKEATYRLVHPGEDTP